MAKFAVSIAVASMVAVLIVAESIVAVPMVIAALASTVIAAVL